MKRLFIGILLTAEDIEQSSQLIDRLRGAAMRPNMDCRFFVVGVPPHLWDVSGDVRSRINELIGCLALVAPVADESDLSRALEYKAITWKDCADNSFAVWRGSEVV